MLFQFDISLDKVQVTKETKPPEPDIFPIVNCPMCEHRMYGHGWRKRYIEDIERESTYIWVHRVYCPKCRMTGTILPRFVHALKLYTLETIRKVIKYRIETGHKNSKIRISRYLQDNWWKRYRLKRTIGDLRPLEEMLCPCGFPTIIELKKREDFRYMKSNSDTAHHRLFLLAHPLPS